MPNTIGMAIAQVTSDKWIDIASALNWSIAAEKEDEPIVLNWN
jgi:hypothetical protein